jgi:hypothetical protein
LSRVSFRQADLERLIRAARRENAVVQVDLRSLIVTITPLSSNEAGREFVDGQWFAPDGKENWDE